MYGFALHDFGSRCGGHRARKQFQSWAGGWTLGLCSLQESLLTHRAWEKLTPTRTTHSSALTEKDHRSDQVMRTKPSRDTVKTLDNYVLPGLAAGALFWTGGGCKEDVRCCREERHRRAALGARYPTPWTSNMEAALLLWKRCKKVVAAVGQDCCCCFLHSMASAAAMEQLIKLLSPTLALATLSSWQSCVEPRLKIWTV